VLATGWGVDRCAYALALLPDPPEFLPRGFTWAAALAWLGALGVALYLAAGSPVRRIRALAADVRRVAETRYDEAVPVRGRDEIAGLAESFNSAAAMVRAQWRAAEDRERALRDFVAHTTHDVGVPLSVLAGALAAIREAGTPGDPIAGPLATANREAHYIASLLHNLGAAARLETGEGGTSTHAVDMAALVDRVVLRHASLARDAGVELNHALPSEGVTVRGDVTLLEQAVNNLVHNAIRHNRPGGHAAVVLDRTDAGFRLSVRDDGPGVPAADLARLGRPRFRSEEARSRHPEGTGLGLAIAGDVARRHGLDLSFRTPGEGGFEAVLSGRTEGGDARR
jgi:signal transduction histidine kinase